MKEFFSGEVGHMLTVGQTIKRDPVARIEVNTPLYTGTKNFLFGMVIGTVPAVRKSNTCNPEWEVVAAAVIKAQAREWGDPKPLK